MYRIASDSFNRSRPTQPSFTDSISFKSESSVTPESMTVIIISSNIFRARILTENSKTT